MRSVGLCKYSQWRRSLISCIPGGLDKPTLYQVTPVGLSQQYKSQQDLPDKICFVVSSSKAIDAYTAIVTATVSPSKNRHYFQT